MLNFLEPLGFLSEDTIAMIENIAKKIRMAFPSYTIETGWYNTYKQVYELRVEKNGVYQNLYLFYPNPRARGKIDSIALYGKDLDSHYNMLSATQNIWEMHITDIYKDSGKEDFLDIYVEY